MKDCHRSLELDSYLGKVVEITYFDGTTDIGILTLPPYGFGYVLQGTWYSVRFRKSHVKKIREMIR